MTITPEQVQFFRDNGFLKLEGVVQGEELAQLRAASQALIDAGPSSGARAGERKDYQYGTVRGVEQPVLRRIEYMYGKGDAFLRLMAHPGLLDAVQQVIGEQFVPTYDSMVIKMPGSGVEVPWHRDGNGYTQMFYDDPATGRRFPAVNCDFYLDEANEGSGALWVVPGSNWHTENRTPALRERGEYAGAPGAVLVPMQQGDLLLHDVMLYHGSPETQGATPLRRVLYYEFRDMRFIDALHRPGWPESWTRARLALLQKALDARRTAGMDMPPFIEHPIPALQVSSEEAATAQTRVPHPGWDEAVEKASPPETANA